MVRAVLGSVDAPVGLTPKELVWRKNKARLYRYVRSEPATHQTPIFLVLPLINRAYILDLRPGASFVEFLLARASTSSSSTGARRVTRIGRWT